MIGMLGLPGMIGMLEMIGMLGMIGMVGMIGIIEMIGMLEMVSKMITRVCLSGVIMKVIAHYEEHEYSKYFYPNNKSILFETK